MSDRMWVGDGRAEFADVNLCDHTSMSAAIKAQRFEQSLKVFGPAQRLLECWREWKRLHYSDEGDVVWAAPDVFTFIVKDDLAEPPQTPPRYWDPPDEQGT